MKILVLDNYETFTLVPYLRKEITNHEIVKMGNLSNNRMWAIFERVSPDVVFIDFCDNNAYTLTNKIKELKKRPKIVIRLHGYELQKWFWNKTEWSAVNDLITVSPMFHNLVKRRLTAQGNLNVKTHMIPNGIDLLKFPLQESKMHDNEIAFVGHLNKKKGPALLRTLIASTPDKHFHIGGVFQDEQVQLYLQSLKPKNVTYYGAVNTVEFLKGKRWILSTSVTESFGMTIAEGMAMGLTPLIHWWPGAELLWPRECLWTTFEEFDNIMPKDPILCRSWIEDRYSMDNCVKKVVNLLTT